MKEDQKRITIDLDEALYKRLKVHAAMSDVTITDIIRELVKWHVPPLAQPMLLTGSEIEPS